MKNFIYILLCSFFAINTFETKTYGNIKLPDKSCIKNLILNEDIIDKNLLSKVDKIVPVIHQSLLNILKGQILQTKLSDNEKQQLYTNKIIVTENTGDIRLSFDFSNHSIIFSMEKGKPTLTFISPNSEKSYVYNLQNGSFEKK